MKKLMSIIILTASLVATLTACGSSNTPITSTNSNNQANSSVTSNEKKTGKSLIVYFAVAENSEVDAVSSASVTQYNGEAKGIVRVLAEMVQSEVGGDMFSIETKTDYPADIYDVIDYTIKNEDGDARPELVSHIDNLDEYDTIYVGYPIWNYTLPMAMYSFFDEYDFSGKTIVPFTSHNGSGLSGIPEDIKKLEPNANVTKGFTVHYSKVLDAEDDVKSWLHGLGY